MMSLSYAPAVSCLLARHMRQQEQLFTHDRNKKVRVIFDAPNLTKRQRRRLKGRKS